jgi:hypothetical protein
LGKYVIHVRPRLRNAASWAATNNVFTALIKDGDEYLYVD